MRTLGVNIDHVATIRQARGADEPDPAWAAMEAQLGGADAIVFHLREDRRHIQDRDATALKSVVNVKLNMEMAMDEAIVAFAESLRPNQCTLVPERREERTTEGGLDVLRHRSRAKDVVVRLSACGICVSAFVEPDGAQLHAARDAGFHAVELWTGAFAHAANKGEMNRSLDALSTAAGLGRSLGLDVHVGHGLTYRNVAAVASLPGLSEFNIGHSIVSRAVLTGIRSAVAEMKSLIQHG